MNLRNFNPRKIAFSDGFWYKTIFPPSTPVIGHVQSDVDFYGESYDGKHVTVAHCTKKFFYEKPRKSRKNHEYSRIFEKISAFFCISLCVLSSEFSLIICIDRILRKSKTPTSGQSKFTGSWSYGIKNLEHCVTHMWHISWQSCD